MVPLELCWGVSAISYQPLKLKKYLDFLQGVDTAAIADNTRFEHLRNKEKTFEAFCDLLKL